METIIRNALELASSGRIDFPTYIDMISQAGVQEYSVDVGNYIITYQGKGQTHVEHMPGALEVSGSFDVEALKNALSAVQRGSINYPTFLERIAQAGIQTYDVDLGAKTVTYQGHGQSLVEAFPDATKK